MREYRVFGVLPYWVFFLSAPAVLLIGRWCIANGIGAPEMVATYCRLASLGLIACGALVLLSGYRQRSDNGDNVQSEPQLSPEQTAQLEAGRKAQARADHLESLLTAAGKAVNEAPAYRPVKVGVFGKPVKIMRRGEGVRANSFNLRLRTAPFTVRLAIVVSVIFGLVILGIEGKIMGGDFLLTPLGLFLFGPTIVMSVIGALDKELPNWEIYRVVDPHSIHFRIVSGLYLFLLICVVPAYFWPQIVPVHLVQDFLNGTFAAVALMVIVFFVVVQALGDRLRRQASNEILLAKGDPFDRLQG